MSTLREIIQVNVGEGETVRKIRPQLGAVFCLRALLQDPRRPTEMGFWLEIVKLVIPGFNDPDDELTRLAEFLAEMSPDIPWHVTVFHKEFRGACSCYWRSRRGDRRVAITRSAKQWPLSDERVLQV